MRSSILGGLLVVWACGLWLRPAAPPELQRVEKYNVLFIVSDDLRPELGSYGNRLIKTPNLDRLAARGVRFDRAFAQFPLCNPSRTSLLTGRYPTQTGVLDNETYFRAAHPDWVSLPQYFKQHGYAALRTGKIFHGGIDDTGAWTEGGEPRAFSGPRREPRTDGASRAEQSDRIITLEGEGESNGDYRTASRAIEYLEKYREQPFFLAVGFAKPHSPPAAPKKFFDLYDPARIPLPPDFATQPAAPPGFPEISIPRRNTDLFIGREASPSDAREMIRAYDASVSFMDAQVGRVIEALDRLKLRERTIIVFFGDHGYHLGEKGKWSKAYSLYEIATRVPLIIAWPQAPARTLGQTVQLLDLYPTLIELCRLPKLQGLEGQSLAALLRNPKLNWNQPAYSVTRYQGKLGRSVSTERWHYAEWDEGRAGAMLFDHRADPLELKNLVDDPRHAGTIREMRLQLTQIPKE